MKVKLIAIWFCLMSLVLATAVEIPHQVLIVTGHNNHKWEVSSVVYKQILEQTGLFNVDMAIRPPLDKETDIFHPNFSQYDVVFWIIMAHPGRRKHKMHLWIM